MKFGDLLLKDRLVTPAQLEEALKCQVIFGGKLGTNLIELGALEEEEVARALSRKHGVPYIDPPDRAMNLPLELLKLVPRDIAARYRVLPVALEGRRLTLAMDNPADLKAVEELGFRTGCVIRPAVLPEVRLVMALEKHYQIPRELRYIPAIKKVQIRKPQAAAEPAKHQEPLPAPVTVIEPEPLELVELSEEDILQETVEEPSAAGPLTTEAVSQALTEARDREEIAATVAAWLGQEFARAGIFLVMGETAIGWKGLAEGKEIAGFDRLQITLDEPSIIRTVAGSKGYYLGPVPRTPFNSLILQEFGGRIPEAVLLVPVVMMGRVIGLLYIDSPGADLAARMPELQKMTVKMAMAFDILIIKRKIMMM